MMEEERHAKISWNKHDEYLKNFYFYYTLAQRLFPLARGKHHFLIQAFDNIHESYRQLLPYINEKKKREEFETHHDEIKKDIDNFSTMRVTDQTENFGKIYYKVDKFFTELTIMAVEKGVFPPLQIDRTAREKADSLRKE
jgi:hypothetical protein